MLDIFIGVAIWLAILFVYLYYEKFEVYTKEDRYICKHL
jgi:hypothetical protein